VLGSATKNEEGEMLYKIELILPEMPNRRKITLRLLPNGTLSVLMEEVPGQSIAAPFVEALYATNPKLSFIISLIEKRLCDRFVEKRIERTFSPVIVGVNVESNDYHRQLYVLQDKYEKKNASAETAAGMLIDLSSRDLAKNNAVDNQKTE
jgi:hypothetical protein